MKQAMIFAVVLTAALTAIAAPPPELHGWNTWQRSGDGGKFERIKPSSEFPQGAMKFLPDPEKKRYAIQWYRMLPATPAGHLRFIFTFRSAADTNPGVTVTLSMKAKDQAGAWCGKALGERRSVAVEPGKTQTVECEIDLRKPEAAEVGSLCPTVVLANLTAGDVTFTAFKIESLADPAAGK